MTLRYKTKNVYPNLIRNLEIEKSNHDRQTEGLNSQKSIQKHRSFYNHKRRYPKSESTLPNSNFNQYKLEAHKPTHS